LHNISKKFSLKKVLLFITLLLGSPGFPVKGPEFAVLCSFTRVVAPAFEVLSLSLEFVSLSVYSFLAAQFLFLSQNRHFR
jgi:hypothetical protein